MIHRILHSSDIAQRKRNTEDVSKDKSPFLLGEKNSVGVL